MRRLTSPRLDMRGRKLLSQEASPGAPPGAARPLKVKGKGGNIAAPCEKAELLDGAAGG